MAKKLFVGNLPFTIADEQLSAIFSPFGTIVSAVVVKDKFSGRSKGFGFVEFETEEDALKAMQALDGTDQEGRNIAVKEALPRPDRVENTPQSVAPVETPEVEKAPETEEASQE